MCLGQKMVQGDPTFLSADKMKKKVRFRLRFLIEKTILSRSKTETAAVLEARNQRSCHFARKKKGETSLRNVNFGNIQREPSRKPQR